MLLGDRLRLVGPGVSMLLTLAAATGCGDDPPAPEGRWWEKCYEGFAPYEEDPASDLIGRPLDEVQIPLGKVAEDGECHAGFFDLGLQPGRLHVAVNDGRIVAVYVEQAPGP